MHESYVKQQIELAKAQKVEGAENARRIEERLKEISDYLDELFGPVSEESIRDFNLRYEKNHKKK